MNSNSSVIPSSVEGLQSVCYKIKKMLIFAAGLKWSRFMTGPLVNSFISIFLCAETGLCQIKLSNPRSFSSEKRFDLSWVGVGH